MDLKPLAIAEREDFAALLDTLSPAQWEAPSLCDGWRARDGVAHVVSYDELDGRALPDRLARGRFFAVAGRKAADLTGPSHRFLTQRPAV